MYKITIVPSSGSITIENTVTGESRTPSARLAKRLRAMATSHAETTTPHIGMMVVYLEQVPEDETDPSDFEDR